jgi:hypothetical protein
MSEPIPRDKLIALINITRQFISINDNEINIIDNWCTMNNIKYNPISLNQNDTHSINAVAERKKDNKSPNNYNIISMNNNVENFLNDIKATIPDDNIIYQNEFTTLLHDYIKTNNLYTSDSKTQFIPDDKILKLFCLKDNNVIGMETLNQLIRDVLCENF